MPVTYHVVVPFDRDDDGNLRPNEAVEMPSAHAADRQALALVPPHAGAVAFSRTGDPATGEFDVDVIARVGEVDLEALAGV